MGLSAAERLVFVYGTLRRGGSNDLTRLHPSADFVAKATVAATLYDLGAYPGASFSESDTRRSYASTTQVTGEVYRITAEIESALDLLEEVEADGTGEYLKRFVDVDVDVDVEVGTVTMCCLAYEIHPSRIKGCPVIVCGDWLMHRIARDRP